MAIGNWFTIREAAGMLGKTEAALRMQLTRQAKRPKRPSDIKTRLDTGTGRPTRYVYLGDYIATHERRDDTVNEIVATTLKLYPELYAPPKGIVNRVKAALRILFRPADRGV